MAERIKVIVAGSRDWPWPNYLQDALTFYLSRFTPDQIEVVCGEAIGPDKQGRLWAEARGIKVKSFPAQWDALGKRAGFVRNVEMADYGTHLIAFWDGVSNGTKHMIETAIERGLVVKVINLLKAREYLEKQHGNG